LCISESYRVRFLAVLLIGPRRLATGVLAELLGDLARDCHLAAPCRHRQLDGDIACDVAKLEGSLFAFLDELSVGWAKLRRADELIRDEWGLQGDGHDDLPRLSGTTSPLAIGWAQKEAQASISLRRLSKAVPRR